MKQNVKLSPIFLCIVTWFLPGVVLADIGITYVEKKAVVTVRGDREQTRERAVKQAVKDAFEEVLLETMKKLPARPSEQKQSNLRKAVYTKMESYVHGSEVISEKPLSNNRYQVKVRAKIDQGTLRNDLEKLLKAKRNPRVLFMIAEKNAGSDFLNYWWGKGGKSSSLGIVENEMTKQFRKRGFTCIDAIGVARRVDAGVDERKALLKDSAALLFGQKGGAEIIIVGKASASDNGTLASSSLHSVQADVSLRVLRIDTGENIASDSVEKTVIHTSLVTASTNGFREAASELTGRIVKQIAAKWSDEVALYTTVQIDVKGVSYTQLLEFGNILKRQCGCTAVHERDFSNNRGQLSVELKGDAQSLAKQIALQNSPHLPLKVTGFSQNKITIEVKGQGM